MQCLISTTTYPCPSRDRKGAVSCDQAVTRAYRSLTVAARFVAIILRHDTAPALPQLRFGV